MKPSVYNYDNYRDYLRDLYDYLKKNSVGFSYRAFAKNAGLSSPNYLKLVMDGDRNLSEKTLNTFARALELTPAETKFFEALVGFSQAKTTERKAKYYSNLIKSKKFQSFKHLSREKFEYYSHWYYAAVRELALSSSFQESPDWISKTLVPNISLQQARDALLVLQQLGLLKRDKEGKLVASDEVVSSGAEAKSVLVKAFHREMLRIAADAQDHFESDERDISGVMIKLSSSNVALIKKKIAKLRRDILASLDDGSNSDARLYQLNIQLFPLMKKESK